MRPAAFERLRNLGPFRLVFDVGGNVGGFAWACSQLWPAATIVSFEPVEHLAEQNQRNANGAWYTEQVAISNGRGEAELRYCVNQHSASSLHRVGPVRRQLGIRDEFETMTVQTRRLDDFLATYPAPEELPVLVKFDVEGHELAAIGGAPDSLAFADAVVVECQNSPEVFEGAATPTDVDRALRRSGLEFAGVLDVFQHDHSGEVFQFDGLWTRPS